MWGDGERGCEYSQSVDGTENVQLKQESSLFEFLIMSFESAPVPNVLSSKVTTCGQHR